MSELPRGPITVDDLVRDEGLVARRIANLLREHAFVRAVFPTPVLTRRERLLRKLRGRRDLLREQVAVHVAPWLERH